MSGEAYAWMRCRVRAVRCGALQCVSIMKLGAKANVPLVPGFVRRAMMDRRIGGMACSQQQLSGAGTCTEPLYRAIGSFALLHHHPSSQPCLPAETIRLPSLPIVCPAAWRFLAPP